MKTYRIRKEDVQRRWVLIDATDQVLGRLAVKAAVLLMGKDKPTYTPGVDSGEFIVLTNASAVRVTGRNETGKLYRHYTGYVGGLVEETLGDVRSKKPEKLIYLAVKRILPKNKLGQQMLRRLKVYAGSEHPHQAQMPELLEISAKR